MKNLNFKPKCKKKYITSLFFVSLIKRQCDPQNGTAVASRTVLEYKRHRNSRSEHDKSIAIFLTQLIDSKGKAAVVGTVLLRSSNTLGVCQHAKREAKIKFSISQHWPVIASGAMNRHSNWAQCWSWCCCCHDYIRFVMMSGVTFQMGEFEFSIAMRWIEWINGSVAANPHTHTCTYVCRVEHNRVQNCLHKCFHVCGCRSEVKMKRQRTGINE